MKGKNYAKSLEEVEKQKSLNSPIFEEIQNKREKTEDRLREIQEAYEHEEKLKRENKEIEDRLYKHFSNYVKSNNFKFIDIDHIDNLGIYYDVLIVTSYKNTGKTHGIMYKLFNRFYEEGKKVFFMRTSKIELKESMPIYEKDKPNPFKFVTHKNVTWLLHKETNEEAGIARDMKSCNAASGGNFEGYAAIFYDEFIPWKAEKVLNKAHYMNWAALISSVTRNKKEGLKIYCLGNLQGKNMGMLDFYGISTDDNLRYIKRYDKSNPDNVCHILYINTNDIYPGIKKQLGAVQGVDPSYRADLTENSGALTNGTVISPKIWDQLEEIANYVMLVEGIQEKIQIMEFRKTAKDRYSNSPTLYALRFRPWEAFLPVKGNIFTNNPVLAKTSTKIKILDDFEDHLFNICELLYTDNIYFFDIVSQEITIQLHKKIKSMQKLFLL